MDNPVNDLVNEALVAWGKLVKLPKAKGNVIQYKNWDEFDNEKRLKLLNKSREQDPTGLTTFMLLRGLTENLLKKIKVSAYALILEPQAIETQLQPMRRLRDILEDERVVTLISDFQNQLREAAVHYGLKDTEGLEALLEDKYELASVRRDALHAIEKLKPFQFVQGKPDPAPPKYNKQIFEFWNINSVLQALISQRLSGVSLILIRDPEQVFASFFIFAVRNGETITILTDRAATPHPRFWKMTRRPDRDLERRDLFRFPYELLDLKLSDDQRRIYAAARHSLVPYNVQGVPLKELADLPADEFVWTVLMFDLIHDRYWTQNLLLPEVSYTAEMIVEPHVLVGADGALVREGHYKPLKVEPYKPEDITAKSTAKQWHHASTGFNRWMVEHYGPKAPNVLNTVGEPARANGEQVLQEFEKAIAVKRKEHFWFSDDERENVLETLSPIAFGTAKELERDRQWVARYNQMAPIQKLAEADYDKHKESTLTWIAERANKNAELFLRAAAQGSLMVPSARWHAGFKIKRRPKVTQVNAMRSGVGRDLGVALPGEWTPSIIWLGADPKRRGRTPDEGYLRPLRPSCWFMFRPNCPEALAVLCGVKVSELPIWLQHWYKDEPYHGNPILDRVDPEDWKLHNPWLDLDVSVGLALTKRGLKELQKRYAKESK